MMVWNLPKWFDKDKASTFVIRSYVNGTLQSVTDAGATTEAFNVSKRESGLFQK